MKNIVLAGGCFWGVEEYYKRLNGVTNTRVGYAQGVNDNPSYKEVCTGNTNHAEVCDVTYDENIITLEQILNHLFRIIDPTSLNKQGEDRGTQYRTGVYYESEEDLIIINEFIKHKQNEFKNPIVVEVEKIKTFFDAEEYHQDYLTVNPTGYCHVDMRKIKPNEVKEEYKKYYGL